MKALKIFSVIPVVMAVLFSCQQPEADLGMPSIGLDKQAVTVEIPASSFTVQVNSNRPWKVTSDAVWVAVDPESGLGNGVSETVTVTVQQNPSFNREAKLVFDIVYDSMQLTVSQKGNGSPEDYIIYSNNFDKTVAEQTYGSSGKSWPYLDQFDGWKNETGVGIGSLTYTFSGASARNNSQSDGTYSDYKGSGKNNILFGTDGYLTINGLTLGEFRNFKLSFGSEKYDNNDKTALFDPSEFLVYASQDGEKWVPVEYTFLGTAAGRWNLAESVFSVSEETNTIYLHIKSKVASMYRLDDLVLAVSDTAGTVLDFSKGESLDSGSGSGSGEGGGSGTGGGDEGEALYSNDFDQSDAAKTYGSGSSWPYLDQFEGWKNESGSGVSTVSYTFSGISVRNNSTSDGTYSDYQGSGHNNLFFGSSSYIAVKDITLGGTKDLKLSFGAEKYDNSNKTALFDPSEFLVYASQDGVKWVPVSYGFKGTEAGRWNLAEAVFSVPDGTEKLSLYIKATAASVYRMDDLKLVASETAGTVLDFSAGIDLDGGFGSGSGSGSGSGEGGDSGSGSGSGSGDVDSGSDDGTAITWKVGSAKQNWAAFSDEKYGDGFKATAYGLTVAYNKSASTTVPVLPSEDHLRLYKDSHLTLSVADCEHITAVELKCVSANGKKYCYDLTMSDSSVAKADTDAMTVSWTGDVAVFSADSKAGQIRISEIKVSYKK